MSVHWFTGLLERKILFGLLTAFCKLPTADFPFHLLSITEALCEGDEL
jgi:hypothetical protein